VNYVQPEIFKFSTVTNKSFSHGSVGAWCFYVQCTLYRHDVFKATRV